MSTLQQIPTWLIFVAIAIAGCQYVAFRYAGKNVLRYMILGMMCSVVLGLFGHIFLNLSFLQVIVEFGTLLIVYMFFVYFAVFGSFFGKIIGSFGMYIGTFGLLSQLFI